MYQNTKGDWVYMDSGELVYPVLKSSNDDQVVASPPIFKRPLAIPQSDASEKKMSKFFL